MGFARRASLEFGEEESNGESETSARLSHGNDLFIAN